MHANHERPETSLHKTAHVLVRQAASGEDKPLRDTDGDMLWMEELRLIFWET